MSSIGEKIKFHRERLRLSATDLVVRIGISRMTLYRYEQDPKAAQNMTLETLNNLATSLHVPAAYLIGQVQPKTYDLVGLIDQLTDKDQNHLRHHIRRLLESQIATKTMPAELRSNNQQSSVDVWGVISARTSEVSQEEYPESAMVPEPVPEHDYALRVDGSLMEPLFSDQQIVYIRRPDYNNNQIRSGQIVIASVNGAEYVRKLVKTPDSTRLVSLNPKYKDIVVRDWDDFEVKGTIFM